MPPLSNEQHEKFAQNIAVNKMNQSAAYQAAGFKPSPANASTLRKKPTVSDRIAELETQANSISDHIKKIKTAEGVTQEWIIEELRDLLEEAKDAGQFKVAKECIQEIAAMMSIGDNNKHTKPGKGQEVANANTQPAINVSLIIKDNSGDEEGTRLFPSDFKATDTRETEVLVRPDDDGQSDGSTGST